VADRARFGAVTVTRTSSRAPALGKISNDGCAVSECEFASDYVCVRV
jgi:hypothetical protein